MPLVGFEPKISAGERPQATRLLRRVNDLTLRRVNDLTLILLAWKKW
jgi:hypothetical protein